MKEKKIRSNNRTAKVRYIRQPEIKKVVSPEPKKRSGWIDNIIFSVGMLSSCILGYELKDYFDKTRSNTLQSPIEERFHGYKVHYETQDLQNNEYVQEALNKFIELPEKYQTVLKKKNLSITFTDQKLEGNFAGVYIGNNRRIIVNTKKINRPFLREVILHEAGHAFDSIIGEEVFDNEYAFSSLEYVVDCSKESLFKDNPHYKTSIEFFAETFRDYYLSKGSRESLKSSNFHMWRLFGELETKLSEEELSK